MNKGETRSRHLLCLNGIEHWFDLIRPMDLINQDAHQILAVSNFALGKEIRLGIYHLPYYGIERFQDDARYKDSCTAKIFLKHTPRMCAEYGVAIHRYRCDDSKDPELMRRAIADMLLVQVLNPNISRVRLVVELRFGSQIYHYDYEPTGDNEEIALFDSTLYAQDGPIIP